MNQTRVCLAVLALLVLVSMAACAKKAPPEPLTLDALKNAEYPSEWPKDGVAKLSDGEYHEKYMEGAASELVIVMHPLYATGDLDGDGGEDAVVVLVTSGGGSGSFYTLEAVLNQEGQPKHVASAALGDRIQLQSVSVESGAVTVQMTTHGPDDPLCCPSVEATQTYKLEEKTLVLVSSDA